jgi:hypothetical protein
MGRLNLKNRRVNEMHGRGIIDSIANRVLDTSKNTLFPGEKHAPLWVDGTFMPARYDGPGTNLEFRVRRGDVGLTRTDAESEAHDLRYGLARNVGDVRAADLKMLSVLQQTVANKTDARFNTLPAMTGITAKVAAEKLGVNPNFFTTFGREHQTPEVNALYEKTLKGLEQQGLGLRRFSNGLIM